MCDQLVNPLKQEFLKDAETVFSKSTHSKKSESELKEKGLLIIGQQKVELDFLKNPASTCL